MPRVQTRPCPDVNREILAGDSQFCGCLSVEKIKRPRILKCNPFGEHAQTVPVSGAPGPLRHPAASAHSLDSDRGRESFLDAFETSSACNAFCRPNEGLFSQCQLGHGELLWQNPWQSAQHRTAPCAVELEEL